MSSAPIEFNLETFAKSRLVRSEPFVLGSHQLTAEQVLNLVRPLLTESRLKRLDEVVAARTYNVTAVLEDIYDLGNISAVMRSLEAFGFVTCHMVSRPGSRFKAANRVSKGSEKWLDVHLHRSPQEAVSTLKAKGFQIFATHLDASVPISEVDFTRPTAIVLGNEKDGVSQDMLDLVDGRFVIPMQGFTQSFNISVAAAISFYHAWREREVKLGRSGDLSDEERQLLLANYYLRCLDKPAEILGRLIRPLNGG